MSMPNDHELKQLEDEMRGPLSAYTVHPVTSGDTARLLQALQPAFDDMRHAVNAFPAAESKRIPYQPSLAKLMKAQLHAYPKMYWLAGLSVLVMLLLISSTFNNYSNYAIIGDMFALVLPATLLAGMLYSFRSQNREMRLVESITPYPPALLILCRMLLVVILTVVLGAIVSLYLLARLDRFPLLPFLLQWMSVLVLVGGVTAYIMMRKGVKTAFACSCISWIAWNGSDLLNRSSGLLADDIQMTLQAAGLAAGLLLLRLAYRRSIGMKIAKAGS
ncbi:hypothetical protein IJ21_39900 [Paenibacillus sp. 32O-W]|uniref:hypothetical protein n=1 Tax=Paenibacillus sp. 32O-W TaxID=1695218 RepID=UPI000721FCF6|nr:hypothetical protein [Paenibacillus sp. 32O-W]ALS29376.1 hypothetical protein IJ21_39900 [Paenibacillus sp. 32O-W]